MKFNYSFLSSNQTCISCESLTGLGSNTDTCQCATYSSPDDTGFCDCINGYIPTIDQTCIKKKPFIGIGKNSSLKLGLVSKRKKIKNQTNFYFFVLNQGEVNVVKMQLLINSEFVSVRQDSSNIFLAKNVSNAQRSQTAT